MFDWLQRLFMPGVRELDEKSDSGDLDDKDKDDAMDGFDEPSTMTSQHLRIMIAIVVVIVAAIIMWWLLM